MKRQTLVAVMAILETDPSVTDEQSDLISDGLCGRLKRTELQPPVPQIPIRPHVEAKPKPETKEFMRINDAAKYMAISPRSIARYRTDGKLPFHKVGMVLILKRSDLDAFMAKCRIAATG